MTSVTSALVRSTFGVLVEFDNLSLNDRCTSVV
jgi:hypothetical protein